jgi:hypothetical protein
VRFTAASPFAVIRKKRFDLPPALGRRVAQVRVDVTFRFQASKSGIDGSDGDLSANAQLNFLPHSDAVRLVSKTQQRKDTMCSNSPR